VTNLLYWLLVEGKQPTWEVKGRYKKTMFNLNKYVGTQIEVIMIVTSSCQYSTYTCQSKSETPSSIMTT